MKYVIFITFGLLIGFSLGFLTGLLSKNTIDYNIDNSIDRIKIINIKNKKEGKIIYEGNSKYVDIIYESLINPDKTDVVKIIIYNNLKEIIYLKRFYKKNIIILN